MLIDRISRLERDRHKKFPGRLIQWRSLRKEKKKIRTKPKVRSVVNRRILGRADIEANYYDSYTWYYVERPFYIMNFSHRLGEDGWREKAYGWRWKGILLDSPYRGRETSAYTCFTRRR